MRPSFEQLHVWIRHLLTYQLKNKLEHKEIKKHCFHTPADFPPDTSVDVCSLVGWLTGRPWLVAAPSPGLANMPDSSTCTVELALLRGPKSVISKSHGLNQESNNYLELPFNTIL